MSGLRVIPHLRDGVLVDMACISRMKSKLQGRHDLGVLHVKGLYSDSVSLTVSLFLSSHVKPLL